jgi:hypothetical protein
MLTRHARAFQPKSPKSVTTDRNTKSRGENHKPPNHQPGTLLFVARGIFDDLLQQPALEHPFPPVFPHCKHQQRIWLSSRLLWLLCPRPRRYHLRPLFFSFSGFFFYSLHRLARSSTSIPRHCHIVQGQFYYESAPTRRYPFPAHPNLIRDIPLLRR